MVWASAPWWPQKAGTALQLRTTAFVTAQIGIPLTAQRPGISAKRRAPFADSTICCFARRLAAVCVLEPHVRHRARRVRAHVTHPRRAADATWQTPASTWPAES